jgi:hypothetical protein
MPLTFSPRSFIATERELKVVGLDRDIPVVFLLDLTVARASLDLKEPNDVIATLERWRSVLETACLRAYARRERGQEYLRIRVDEEDFSSALAADAVAAR